MRPARGQSIEKGAIELIEEAVHLLRRAPLSTLAFYYVGSLPFVIGLLYFWAEMSRSPFASEHLAAESLGLALLFLWMKLWQARFARALWMQVAGHSEASFGWRNWRNLLVNQSALQVTGLFLLPVALVLTVPFGWMYAFYQSLTASGEGEKAGSRDAFSKARKNATLWPGQNHKFLLILFGFGAFVFVDWITVILAVPALAKILLGIETVFTRSPLAVLNSTFFAAMLALTYLSVDPLLKAVYTLRCFYGEARSSGEDIRAELRQFRHGGIAVVAVAAVVLSGVFGVVSLRANGTNPMRLGYAQLSRWDADNAFAATASEPSGPASSERSTPTAVPSRASASESVSPPDLDKQIAETLKESKYTWRFPRDMVKQPANAQQGVFGRFMDRVGKWLSSVRDWLEEILRKRSSRQSTRYSGSGSNWIIFVHLLLYVLIAAVVVAVAILIYRLLRGSKENTAAIATVPIQPAPDLTDENVDAEQLPEDGWTALGRELLQKGEFRLALRAFYLSSLAHLASRNLINLARFKSNRDYHRELERRAHSFPQVLALFGENVTVFDRTWYGMHETSLDLVNQFLAKVEMIKAA